MFWLEEFMNHRWHSKKHVHGHKQIYFGLSLLFWFVLPDNVTFYYFYFLQAIARGGWIGIKHELNKIRVTVHGGF